MTKWLKIVLYVISPILWFALLCSISLAMFYWRVANEPGASDIPVLQSMALYSFFIGIIGTLNVNTVFACLLRKNFSNIWRYNAIATALYIPFFLLTLLMMV